MVALNAADETVADSSTTEVVQTTSDTAEQPMADSTETKEE